MGITQNTGASSLIKPGVIDNTAARPASPYEGQVIFQKDTDQLLVWNGTAWVIPNSPAQNPMGLELVKTQTIGTGVSTIVVDSAFSSTYDNYRIIINSLFGSVNTANLYIRFANLSNHYGSFSYNLYSNTTLSFDNANTSTRMSVGFVSSVVGNYVFDVMNPNKVTQTFVTGTHYAAGYGGFHAGEYSLTTSFTEFTILPSSGTLTGGTVTVYGYRKA